LKLLDSERRDYRMAPQGRLGAGLRFELPTFRVRMPCFNAP
jgi:hypothetical protein